MYPENDTEYEESRVDKVESYASGGWSITFDDGWSFMVQADSPVTPSVGMTARKYGKGIGYAVRGLFLNGQCVYYRTEAEEKVHGNESLYGRDLDEWLARWDRGESVWSIEMGGLGPGYEQAIQCLVVELVRRCRDFPAEGDEAGWRQWGEAVISEMDKQHGYSGAQVGAAKNLAAHLIRKGPIGVFTDERVKDRHIQVCRDFPRALQQARGE